MGKCFRPEPLRLLHRLGRARRKRLLPGGDAKRPHRHRSVGVVGFRRHSGRSPAGNHRRFRGRGKRRRHGFLSEFSRGHGPTAGGRCFGKRSGFRQPRETKRHQLLSGRGGLQLPGDRQHLGAGRQRPAGQPHALVRADAFRQEVFRQRDAQMGLYHTKRLSGRDLGRDHRAHCLQCL